ncbi:MAG: phospholipid carrier-dependent glycosyltransferase [Candidatus Dormibacteria bacterium]
MTAVRQLTPPAPTASAPPAERERGAAPSPRSLPAAVPRIGGRAFLGLDRPDLAWLLGLVALAFVIRVATPVYPDFLEHPFTGAPVHASGITTPFNTTGCQSDVPVGPRGGPVKRCGFVFDEVYFPVDAAKDLHQPAIDYFDPEPPLAKLVMAPPIAWLGFTPLAWRIAPAVFGSLLVGIVYLIGRRLRRERYFAVVAAGAVTLDGLAIVESRTGVIDMIAVTFVALFYYAFLLHWQARTPAQWRATLYVGAVVGGLAFGAKLTALAPLAVAVAFLLGRGLERPLLASVPVLQRLRRGDGGAAQVWRSAAGRAAVAHYAAAALLAGVVFVTCFARYSTVTHVVPRYVSCTQATGPQGSSSTEPVALRVVHGIPNPDPVTMVRNTSDAMGAGLQYHEHECRPHPYASRWYTWPIMYHPVLFYYSAQDYVTPAGSAKVASVSDLGNPALWWLGALALLFCAWRMTAGWATLVRVGVGALGTASLTLLIISFRAAQQPDAVSVLVHPGALFALGLAGLAGFAVCTVLAATLNHRFVPAFIVLGYLVAWLMWMPGNESRILFFYHALGSLPLLALGFAYALTALRRARPRIAGHTLHLIAVSRAAIVLVVAAFVFFLPLWTAMPLFSADRTLRLWLSW